MNEAVAPGVGVQACRVRLSAFQGPLDLLIHLVRTGAIDAADLSMTEIATQYDAYVAMMRRLDLEAAGESLILVASLVHMKSRQLLPQPPAVETPGSEEGPPSSHDAPALRQALRVAAEHLQEREAVMELIYHRADSTVADYAGEQGIEADLFALLSAFRSILRRVGTDPAAR